MPRKDIPIEELQEYTGSTPCPADFQEFWDRKIREAWEHPLNYTITPSEIPASPCTRYYDVWMEGIGGGKLYAKYVLPISKKPVPVVLQFHGYPGSSRGWFEQSSFAGMGMAVLAMECPGQGGASVYAGAPAGTTAADHIVMGLAGEPDGLYYVEAFMDTCLMVRLALALEQLDSSRIYVNGASQGGGLGLVCTALNTPYIRKCATLYPFLADYRRAWDMDRDLVVFTGMKYCSRWFDPTGEHLDAMFTKLGYIDVMNFVERITCPVLFGTGLMDEFIPPSAQFAVYQRIQSPKQHLIYPDYGHEEIFDFDDRIIDFLRRRTRNMPGTDLPLEKLQLYKGSYPCPVDFEVFWLDIKQRIDLIRLCPRFERQAFNNPHAMYYRVSIEAPDGSVLQAKYIRPATDQKVPCVLQLHDYPAVSRGWFHLTRYIAIGTAVLAPECRGQGGYSCNHSSYAGPLAYGPMFNGLEGPVDQLYLFRLIEDALLWAKVMQMLDGIDVTQLSVYGEGQGGGLAIACAAMYPEFQKCAAHYPMLCDYRRVWDMDFDVGLYEGLRYFFRWHDPLHKREQEVFDKLAYVDAKNFAPLVKARALISTGLQDNVSPPSAQFAIFNNLETDKQHLVYPKHGHELNNFFENELLKFLLK